MVLALSTRRLVRRRLAALRARLFRTACAWSNDRALADDLVQQASVRALEKAGALRDPAAVDAWLFSILVNCHRDHLRRAARDPVVAQAPDPVARAELGPDCQAEERMLIEAVRGAIARLGDEQRKVLTLVDLEGFSYVEVASILDLPMGTVMSRLSRARQRLKSILDQPGPRSAQVSYLIDKT